MMSRLVRATEIKKFYVWTRHGFNFFNERLQFGEEIDVRNLSPVTIQNLCDQRLIGSREQVEQTASKIGIVLKSLEERKECVDSRDTIDLLIAQQSQNSNNLRGKRK